MNYDPDEYPPEDNPFPPEEEDEDQPTRGTMAIPMGELNTGEMLTGLVAFTRSVNLGTRDDNAHFRVEWPFAVQPGWTMRDIAAHAADAFFHVKALIYDQAGLPFTVDEGGVLRETLRTAFPDAEPVQQRQRPAPERRDQAPRRDGGGGSSGGSPRFPHPRDLDQPDHIDDELWWDLVENYERGWYDNRPRKAGKWRDENGQTMEPYKATASDFVRKSDRTSVWLRPFTQKKAAARGRSTGGRGYDD